MNTIGCLAALAQSLAEGALYGAGRRRVVQKYQILEDEPEMRQRLLGRIGRALRGSRRAMPELWCSPMWRWP